MIIVCIRLRRYIFLLIRGQLDPRKLLVFFFFEPFDLQVLVNLLADVLEELFLSANGSLFHVVDSVVRQESPH